MHGPATTLSCVIAIAALSASFGCSRPGGQVETLVVGGDMERGRSALDGFGCGTCHVIPGVRGAVGGVGPPLTRFADRAYIAGQLANDPQNLIRWIQDPQSVEPGTAMPTLGVGQQVARDMAAYLYSIR
jgi:cytochrome c2